MLQPEPEAVPAGFSCQLGLRVRFVSDGKQEEDGELRGEVAIISTFNQSATLKNMRVCDGGIRTEVSGGGGGIIDAVTSIIYKNTFTPCNNQLFYSSD